MSIPKIDPQISRKINSLRRMVDDAMLQHVAGEDEAVGEVLKKIQAEALEAEKMLDGLDLELHPRPRMSKETENG